MAIPWIESRPGWSGVISAVAALSLLVATAPSAEASPVHEPPLPRARTVTTISGPAGGQVELRIDRTVLLNNAAFDSDVDASSGRYAGILVAKTGNSYKHLTRDWYLHYRLTDEALCPGEQCPLPRFMEMAASGEEQPRGDGSYWLKLRPGRYTAILLGEPGAEVTTTLRLRGLKPGKLKLATTGHARLTSEAVDPIAAGDGREVVNRAYYQDDVGGPRFEALVVGFAVSLPGAAGFSWCFTVSEEPGFAPTSAICAGGGGGAIPQPLIGTGTAYGMAYVFGFIPSGYYFSQGYDANALTTRSRIPAIRLVVDFPSVRSAGRGPSRLFTAQRPASPDTPAWLREAKTKLEGLVRGSDVPAAVHRSLSPQHSPVARVWRVRGEWR